MLVVWQRQAAGLEEEGILQLTRHLEGGWPGVEEVAVSLGLRSL
jgi:hypothetical protein